MPSSCRIDDRLRRHGSRTATCAAALAAKPVGGEQSPWRRRRARQIGDALDRRVGVEGQPGGARLGDGDLGDQQFRRRAPSTGRRRRRARCRVRRGRGRWRCACASTSAIGEAPPPRDHGRAHGGSRRRVSAKISPSTSSRRRCGIAGPRSTACCGKAGRRCPSEGSSRAISRMSVMPSCPPDCKSAKMRMWRVSKKPRGFVPRPPPPVAVQTDHPPVGEHRRPAARGPSLPQHDLTVS